MSFTATSCENAPRRTAPWVPRKFSAEQAVDRQLIVAELQNHVYSESVTAGMGSVVSGDVISEPSRFHASAVSSKE